MTRTKPVSAARKWRRLLWGTWVTLVLIDDGQPVHVVSRVPEGDATQENVLRDLIFDHPTILPFDELEPGIGRVISVATEVRLPGAGIVDVLLVSEHGRLIVVECKLWRNPQARREVVGQILDYARELARYAYEDLQRTVSNRLNRPGNVLFALARDAGSTMTESAFVDRVTRDLAAGRFLLLVVGDGITEGTRRIGEFLSGQAGLAFEFGLVEMAEYRFIDPETGSFRRIMQPQLLARTTVIERHVIRNEAPSVTIEELNETAAPGHGGQPTAKAKDSETSIKWREFAHRFIAQIQFDDPAQARPRIGGHNWMTISLPGSASLTVWRLATGSIGVFVRMYGAEGRMLYDALEADEAEIAAEFQAAGLPTPVWNLDGKEPSITTRSASPQPWDPEREAEQQVWLTAMSNQFVNSFRPRLLKLVETV